MAKRKIKAEEEIKKEKELDLEKDDKDLDIKEEVEETSETEEKDEEVPATEEKEDLIVLSDGATVEEDVKLTEEEAADLAKITKVDGTEIFVETPEGSDEEKKEIYEAIVEAEKPEDEVAEELEDEVNDEVPEAMEEIEEVGYVPAACHTAHASLNNSYYILKLKGGKLKALKAGKILNKELKASIISAYKAGKKLPEAETVFNKIASKVGTTFGAFTRLASKLSNKIMKKANRILPNVGDTIDMGNGKEVRVIAKKAGLLTLANGKKVLASQFMPDNTPKVGDTLVEDRREFKIVASKNGILTLENGKKVLAKHLVATDLPDTIPGKDNDKADMLKNFSIDEADIKKDDIDSTIALEKAELEEGKDGVKAAPSKVKSLYNRLPSKSGVSEDVEWSMKDFNGERNKANKTLASQIKALRDATKEIRNQKEVLASKDEEIKSLQDQLAAFNNKEQTMLKSAKIHKILASMNITDDEEKAAMTEKFAKYTKAQLDAVYETLTACPSEEAVNMHERMINDEMKKEASALKGFVPGFKLEEDVKASASDEMEKLVLERELDSIGQ